MSPFRGATAVLRSGGLSTMDDVSFHDVESVLHSSSFQIFLLIMKVVSGYFYINVPSRSPSCTTIDLQYRTGPPGSINLACMPDAPHNASTLVKDKAESSERLPSTNDHMAASGKGAPIALGLPTLTKPSRRSLRVRWIRRTPRVRSKQQAHNSLDPDTPESSVV